MWKCAAFAALGTLGSSSGPGVRTRFRAEGVGLKPPCGADSGSACAEFEGGQGSSPGPGRRGLRSCGLPSSGPGPGLRSSASSSGLNAGFLLRVGAVPLVSEPGYVPSGGRVVPAESAILPPEVQVQDRAVALVSPVVNPFNGDGLVGAVNQPVAGQGRPVVLAPRVVKAPVFRDAQGGVAIPLYGDVPEVRCWTRRFPERSPGACPAPR